MYGGCRAQNGLQTRFEYENTGSLFCKMGNLTVTVLLYDDTGTSNTDVVSKAVKAALTSIMPTIGKSSFHVMKISAEDIIDGTCFTNANMVIVPGGRDLPYVAKLRGSGIENIKKFIEKGGRYFGICAGAYFASSVCEFEKGSDLEVYGERDLKLYPGKAKGCIYPGFQYDSENGAWMINVNLAINHEDCFKNGKFPVYYNGGCEFILECQSDSQTVEIIANYEDFPDKHAIVLCKYGDGRALLSGVHPEINHAFLEDKSKYSVEQLQIMSAKSQEQQKLLELLLKTILV